MKRILFSLFLIFGALSASAMNYSDAREYAYFLTDKMAYELNLTPEQYDRVYEVNLDYFLSVNSRYDLYGRYRDYRDNDLRYILSDLQYARYMGIDYFYRPLSWRGASFVFNVYNRYYYRDSYFFDRPSVYISYRGSDWGYRRPDMGSPFFGITIERHYGGLRDSYMSRYGDRGYDSYYRNAPLHIVEGRYGGRGESYATGREYYGVPSYGTGSYSVGPIGAPPRYGNPSYAPSRGGYYESNTGSRGGNANGQDMRGGLFGGNASRGSRSSEHPTYGGERTSRGMGYSVGGANAAPITPQNNAGSDGKIISGRR